MSANNPYLIMKHEKGSLKMLSSDFKHTNSAQKHNIYVLSLTVTFIISALNLNFHLK